MTQHDPLAGSDTYDILAGLPHKKGGRMGDEFVPSDSQFVDDLPARLEWIATYVNSVEMDPYADTLRSAAAELRRLRSAAGAVSQGSGDFRTIARSGTKTSGC